MKIAVMGYGTVGSGVVEVIESHSDVIAKRTGGETLELGYILDLRDFPEDSHKDKFTKDFNDILNDPEVKIVAEAMGGVNPAFDFTMKLLKAGKAVVTSNKELVAQKGLELLKAAEEGKTNYLFEASVGGGIPIIRPINQCITADEIQEINGILNGTTNFILTKMAEDGADFGDVLKEAQELGYAEKDPTADVEGYDACRKRAILTSLAYGKQVDYEDIYTEGITKITAADFKYAEKMNAAIKIFGTSKKIGDRVYAMVAPQVVGHDHPLYSVNGVFNAISVTGNMLGDVMFYGAGAGKLPTASAVVADVVAAVKHQGEHVPITWSSDKLDITPLDEMENRFFVRVGGEEREKAAGVFGEVQMIDAGIAGECGFVTPVMKEKEFSEKVKALDTLITRIRVQ